MQKVNNKKIKAIIFDMDGVIVDSARAHIEAEMLTCRHFKISAKELDWRSMQGKTARECFGFLVKKYGGEETDVAKIIEYYKNLYTEMAINSIQMFPGVKDLLAAYKGKMKLALGTSGRKDSQRMVFNKFNLDKYFDVVVTGDDITKGKPNPEIFNTVIENLKLESKSCLVIEDADNGIVAAKRAGAMVAAFTSNFERKHLEKFEPDFIFDKFSELKDWLEV